MNNKNNLSNCHNKKTWKSIVWSLNDSVLFPTNFYFLTSCLLNTWHFSLLQVQSFLGSYLCCWNSQDWVKCPVGWFFDLHYREYNSMSCQKCRGLKTALWHSFWDKIENRPALTYIIVLYQCAVTLALCELDMHMPCCVDYINGKKISEEYDFCLSNSAVLYTPYYS